jgi:hypothetical protein
MQPFGGATEVQLLGNANEPSEQTQFQIHARSA